VADAPHRAAPHPAARVVATTAPTTPGVATALRVAGTRHGIHGGCHWRRVAEVGLHIADAEGVDRHAVLLFAILHDCRRENDGHDPGHGPRAAALARALGHSALGVSPRVLERLAAAMHHHTDGHVSDDPLIGACWDADRLDLPRVGIAPEPAYLSTTTARDGGTIARFADFRREPMTWEDLERWSTT